MTTTGPVELDANCDGIIDDQYLPLPFNADAAGVYSNPAINIGYTPEGGAAFKLTNRTGSASIKGQAINFDPANDDSYIAATDPYTVTGFVYNAGVSDGQPVWVVYKGIADAILQDGFAAARGGWARLSPTDAGRVVVQNAPGYERTPSSITYTKGSTVSGALTDLLLDNGVKFIVSEATGTPGVDATFTFTVDEQLSELRIAGYSNSETQFSVWNYTSGAWGSTLITFPAGGTTDVVYTATGLTDDNYNAGEMRVRMLEPSAGNTSRRIYLDKLVLANSAANEHFRELGHVMRATAAGTDVLARLNIHFL